MNRTLLAEDEVLKKKRALLKYDDAPPSASGLEVAVYLAAEVDAKIARLQDQFREYSLAAGDQYSKLSREKDAEIERLQKREKDLMEVIDSRDRALGFVPLDEAPTPETFSAPVWSGSGPACRERNPCDGLIEVAETAAHVILQCPRCGGCVTVQKERIQQAAKANERQHTMRITYERAGRCLWHEDCDKSRCGIMTEVRREESRTLLRCLHCERQGYFPVGATSACVPVELITDDPPRCEKCQGWHHPLTECAPCPSGKHLLTENVLNRIRVLQQCCCGDTPEPCNGCRAMRSILEGEYPECSGDPNSCPENEGQGCCERALR